jgi:DNA-directed RNA polymerase sigma subunit (sigma70/sigma32)
MAWSEDMLEMARARRASVRKLYNVRGSDGSRLYTMSEIGEKLGITKQRVSQILSEPSEGKRRKNRRG